jgi:hypothetical protein
MMTRDEDPLWLWNLIDRTMIGIDADLELLGDDLYDQRMQLETRGMRFEFEQKKQEYDESGFDYHHWFTSTREALITINIEYEEIIVATNFIMNLNQSRFGALKDQLKNALEIQKRNDFPKTVTATFKMANAYEVLLSSNDNIRGINAYVYTNMGKTPDDHDEKECHVLHTNSNSNSYKPKQAYQNNNKSKGYQADTNDKNLPVGFCTHCGLIGHLAQHCRHGHLTAYEC